jgi:hypothetical protein
LRIRVLTIFLLGFSALKCDLGHYPPAETPQRTLKRPWIAGMITSASMYPAHAVSGAEVVVSWGSDSSSSVTDTSGRFIFQQLPRVIVTFRATATDRDTVTLPLDLISSDTLSIEAALKQLKGFVPGEIIGAFEDTTSLRACARFAEAKGLPIKRATGFQFVTDSISADSAKGIQRVLSGKPYLTGGSLIVKNGRITVWNFRDLTPGLLRDWESTCLQLGFREIASYQRYALLSVSPGTEHEWMRNLSGEPILRYICLNGTGTISEAFPPIHRLQLTKSVMRYGK